MTKTVYSLKSLAHSSLTYVSDISKNIFDIIITNKKFILGLKYGNENNGLSKINKCADLLVKEDFIHWDNLYKPGILYSFGLKANAIKNLSQITDDIIYANENINSVLLRCKPINHKRIIDAEKSWIDELNNDVNYLHEIILFLLFQHRKIKTTDFRQMSIDFLEDDYCIKSPSESEWDSIVDYLLKNKYMIKNDGFYIFPSNIFYKSTEADDSIHLSDILKLDFKDSDILHRRLNGETLQSISLTYDQSRERIRQRQSRILKLIPNTYEENKYKDIFQKYKISLDDFLYLFNEDKYIYEFLKLVSKTGIKKLTYESIMNEPMFKNFAIDEKKAAHFKIENKNEYVSKFDELLIDNKEIIFTPESFFDLFNKSHIDDRFKNVRVVEGKILRCRLAISDEHKKFRYYNFKEHNQKLEQLGRIIDSLPDGIYSMFKVYKDYPYLMKEMDIRNEYELHNFIRRNMEIFNNRNYFKNVELGRSPGIMKNFNNKNDFIIKKLKEFSGKRELDFVDYMFREFGHKKSSFRAFLDSDFKEFMFNGFIISREEDINEEGIKKLKNVLTDDIYLRKDFESNVLKFFDKVTPEILYSVGYFQIGDVYIYHKLESASGAIYTLINKCGLHRRDYLKYFASSTIKSATINLQTNMEVFQLNRNLYCTIDYLESIDISKEDVIDFVKKVINKFKDYDYFSVHMVIEKLSDDNLVLYGFDNVFYDDILNYSCAFNVIKNNMNGGDRIFSTKDSTADDFIESELKQVGKNAYLIDFVGILEDKYRTKINDNFVIEHVGYYASKIKKVFLDKEYYFEIWEE